jgi:phenylpyruvate tautomerase PptA (4-oxalocrotonate tautomerase family)
MPNVLFSTRRGWIEGRYPEIIDAVHGAMMATLNAPEHDKDVRIAEYEPEHYPPPPGKGYMYSVVEVDLFGGRTVDAKRAFYKEVVTRLEYLGVPKTDVKILLRESPPENWGIRGGVAACDVAPGRKIDP